jgi:hypothetical protein
MKRVYRLTLSKYTIRVVQWQAMCSIYDAFEQQEALSSLMHTIRGGASLW